MSLAELAQLQHDRRALLTDLLAEITVFNSLTSTPMTLDMELFQGILQFSGAFAEILSLSEEISQSIDQFTQSKRKTIVESEMLQNRLLEEHGVLLRELETAKAMSKSVTSRAVSIKNQRLAPILDFIWEATNKVANAQTVGENAEFCLSVFDILNCADSRESVFAALGILVNVSASEKGLLHIAESIGRNGFDVIPKIAEICTTYGEPRTKQLSLYLIHNLLRHPDLTFQVIKENCFQWICDFGPEFCEEREKSLLLGIIDTLVDDKYAKTIRYCCKDSLQRLTSELSGPEFIAINAKIAKLTSGQERPAQLRQSVRFGFPRVYH
jgi:hypothetical protein